MTLLHSTCPHDCPSACALDIQLDDDGRLATIRGSADQPYTAGTICAKVARYADRLYHPERLTQPLRRTGSKGSGQFAEISWDEALDEVAERFQQAIGRYGAETVWPYYYAGTMGQLQRNSILSLTHVGGFSRMDGTVCTRIAASGWQAGVGDLLGSHPEKMAESELLILWGSNAAATQINVITHFNRAKKARGAKLVVVDVYRNATAAKADLFLQIRPGSDGALACAVAQVLLSESLVDREFLAQHSDFTADVEAHLLSCTPEWAAEITGLSVADIREFAHLYGHSARSFIRLGIGLSRSRNGASNVHAISCLPTLKGDWHKPGSGALLMTSGASRFNPALITAQEAFDSETRLLDMSRIGAVLTGEAEALQHGPPVTAMLMQNVNPATIAPNLNKVQRGLSRDDLFLCVHEQFMTDTAKFADIVLPATMFLEHDDCYSSYGHTYLQAGPKAVDALAACRSNHQVVSALAKRLGLSHSVFDDSSTEVLDNSLALSGYGSFKDLTESRFVDQTPAGQSDILGSEFPQPDGKFHFKADWQSIGPYAKGMPTLPTHWAVTDEASEAFPLRLVTPPKRDFLNSSFNNCERSRKPEGKPQLWMHAEDAQPLGILDGALCQIQSRTGELRLTVKIHDATPVGTVIAEGIWAGSDHPDGLGINVLISDEPPAPAGGAVFHDTAVRINALG